MDYNPSIFKAYDIRGLLPLVIPSGAKRSRGIRFSDGTDPSASLGMTKKGSRDDK